MRGRALTIAVLVCAGFSLVFLTYVLYLIPATPSIEDLRQARKTQASELLTVDGQKLDTFSQTQKERVTLEHVSPYVVQALVATEDRHFYTHHGVDFGRTASAIFHSLIGDAQGGSTITQQLARNLFPEEIGRSRNVHRKFKEIITAFKIERAYSKQQILETYLNTVPFLYNVYGIELAARTYFDKSAADLDVLESATLVGMLKGTNYYNPVLNPERAVKRRNVVLRQMVKYQQLSEAQYQALRDKPLQVRFNRQLEQSGAAPHFVAQVRKWLIDWADQNDYDLYRDGLVVTTTLDLSLQNAANSAVERQAEALQSVADVEWARSAVGAATSATAAYAKMRAKLQPKLQPFQYFWAEHPDLLVTFIRESPEYKTAIDAGQGAAPALAALEADAPFMARMRAGKTRLEAGFVAIDPSTGEVRAWVGSRDFGRDQFDHVQQAQRQPGSTFKPIVYGAALELGISPDRVYEDQAIEIRSADGSVWRPTDMTGASGLPMTLREGLIYSKNTITAQVMQDVGLPNIVSLARAVGINQSRLDPVPSLALGTSPVTLLEMVSAYSTIAQQGAYRKPVFVKKIADSNGKVLADFSSESQPAMSAHSAIELIDMMRGVVNLGTGTAVKTRFGIVADIAGKTGTTQNNTDGWFILMHPNLVAGSWVGFNDARVTMRSNYWGQGGHNAVLIVGDFFRAALKTKLIDVKARFPRPDRDPVIAAPSEPIEDWMDDNGASSREPGVVTGEKEGSAGGSTEVGAEELERTMTGMGRDPVSGASIQERRETP